jgi:hypothetical protein
MNRHGMDAAPMDENRSVITAKAGIQIICRFWTPAFAGVTLFRLDRYELRKGIFTMNGYGIDAAPGDENRPDVYCPLPTNFDYNTVIRGMNPVNAR